MSKVKLSEFDLYGIFRLNKDEIVGIEDLVHKLNNNKYLSRNAGYYPRNWDNKLFFRDICTKYEQLNALLPMSGKPAFVVCEKMHELATRVANTIQKENKIHLFQDGVHFDTVAQKCAQECANNLVRLIHDQPATKTTMNLRDETKIKPEALLDCRIVFQDNKKQLYMCANALPDDIEHLITPGRGSSKLGTLVQAVRQHKGLKPLGLTQIYYSLYSNGQDGRVFPQPLENLPEKLLVMDDVIYHGSTLHRIKKELTQQGHQVINGAVTATFSVGIYKPDAVIEKDNLADYIDIVPNQYVRPRSDQEELRDCLRTSAEELPSLLRTRRNGAGYNTADYVAMCTAEKYAANLGFDLYQASNKISPAAVEYNQKIRAQVEKYNDEFQKSLSF